MAESKVTISPRQELRASMLRRRSALDAAEGERLSVLAQRRLMNAPAWRTAESVALYVAVRGEMRTDVLLQNAWSSGKTVYLPRCVSKDKCDGNGSGVMLMIRCAGPEFLKRGAYGILEPDPALCPDESHACDWDSPGAFPDLVVTPGVAFDRRGNRLGFGGGYYDRLLSFAACAACGKKPAVLAVGLAYDFQVLEDLSLVMGLAEWDHPLNGLCTEKELLWF